MQHFNQLTPAEAERLAILIEECGETIQAASKVLRHGWESYDPTLPEGERVTNRMHLSKEIGHIYAAVNTMTMVRPVADLAAPTIYLAQRKKSETIHQWTHHQS